MMSKTSKEAFIQLVSAMFFLYKNSVSSVAQTRTRFLFNSMTGRSSPAVVSPSVAHLLNFYSHQYVALKICVSHADPKHELEIFAWLSGTPNVLQLRDHFSLQGPNGVHTFLVLNVLGNLRSVVSSSKGPGHNFVRKLCHDITSHSSSLRCIVRE